MALVGRGVREVCFFECVIDGGFLHYPPDGGWWFVSGEGENLKGASQSEMKAVGLVL